MKTKKVRLSSYVDEPYFNELKRFMKLRGASQGTIVQAALKVFFSQTEHEAVIDRRLNKLQNQNEQIKRDQQILLETLAAFIKVYLVHTPEIPLEQKLRMEDMGAERFGKFVQLITKAFAKNHLFRESLDKRIIEECDFNDSKRSNDASQMNESN